MALLPHLLFLWESAGHCLPDCACASLQGKPEMPGLASQPICALPYPMQCDRQDAWRLDNVSLPPCSVWWLAVQTAIKHAHLKTAFGPQPASSLPWITFLMAREASTVATRSPSQSHCMAVVGYAQTCIESAFQSVSCLQWGCGARAGSWPCMLHQSSTF